MEHHQNPSQSINQSSKMEDNPDHENPSQSIDQSQSEIDVFPNLEDAMELSLTPRQVLDLYAMLNSPSGNLANFLVASLEEMCPVETPPVIKTLNQLITLMFLSKADLWTGGVVFVSPLIDPEVDAEIWQYHEACDLTKFELLPSPLDREDAEPESTIDGWIMSVLTTMHKFLKIEFESSHQNFDSKFNEVSEFVKHSQILATVTNETTLAELRELAGTLDTTLTQLVAMARATPKKVRDDLHQTLSNAVEGTAAHHASVNKSLTSLSTSVNKSKDEVKDKIQKLIDDKPAPAPAASGSKTREALTLISTKIEEKFDDLQKDFISRSRIMIKSAEDAIKDQPKLNEMVSEILVMTKSLAESGNEDLGSDLTDLCRERALLAFHFDPLIWGVDVHKCSKMEMYASILDKGDRLVVAGGKMESFISKFFDGVVCSEQLEVLAPVFNPKLIAAGPENKVNYPLIRAVCDKLNAIFLADLDMADMKEVLEASEYADVVITSTSRGKLLFYRKTVEKTAFHGGFQEIPRSKEELTDLAKLLKQFCV